MSDLWKVALGAGLHDGLNPCIFISCAFFIMLGIWFPSSGFKIGFLRLFFVFFYIVGVLAFNFGPAQVLYYQKYFVVIAKAIYGGLGIWAFILGLLFIKDWYFLYQNKDMKGLVGPKNPKVSIILAYLLSFALAMVLSGLASIWPINNYILILGNEALLRGQWHTVIPLLLVYTLTSIWSLWFLWWFLSIRNLSQSLLKIVCASVFFTASSSVILIFK